MQFAYVFFLIALIRVSSSLLNRISDRGHLYLVPDFSGAMPKTLSLNTMLLTFFFNVDTLDQIRKIPFFSYFAENFCFFFKS